MRYENFQYVPGTQKQLATVDLVSTFLWFKWKKRVQLLRERGDWVNASYGSRSVKYLEILHNATATV